MLDPGVLRTGPLCEFGSHLAAEATDGQVIQPWKDVFLAAQKAGIKVAASSESLATGDFMQAIVHLQKSRAATFEDLAEAWRILGPGGQLLLSGTNTLGVVSAVKKLAEQLGQTGVVVTNRAKARVVRFLKTEDGAGPVRESTAPIDVSLAPLRGEIEHFEVDTAPGVFSAKKLDTGSEVLLEQLAPFVGHKAPSRIVDLGCGTGLLGLAAARLWPDAEVLLVDADARAVACAAHNIEKLGLGDRCRTAWWDAREAPLENRFQLALVNPPFHHRGPEVDLGPALALFESLGGWLKIGGRALLVANRTLPYENALSEIGELNTLRTVKGYKLLSLKRSARSSGASGRNAPAGRSAGNEKSPIRSR